MKLHEVRLKPEAQAKYGNKRILQGRMSKWDTRNRCFYLLLEGDPNARFQTPGANGTCIPFEDCVGVFQEEANKPGVFESNNLILGAEQHAKQTGF